MKMRSQLKGTPEKKERRRGRNFHLGAFLMFMGPFIYNIFVILMPSNMPTLMDQSEKIIYIFFFKKIK
jgi:hypothetical protein